MATRMQVNFFVFILLKTLCLIFRIIRVCLYPDINVLQVETGSIVKNRRSAKQGTG